MSDARQRAYIAALCDSPNVAVIGADPEDEIRITEWSATAERIFGWKASDIVGERSSELIALEAGLRERELADLRAAGSWYGRSVLRCKSGELVAIDGVTVEMTVGKRLKYFSLVREAPQPTHDPHRIPSAWAATTAVTGPSGAIPTRDATASITVDATDEQLDEHLHALLSANIRLARRLMSPHRSQTWLADRLGVPRRVVVRWENGQPPKLRTIARIGGLLRQPLEFFYTEHAAVNDRDAPG